MNRLMIYFFYDKDGIVDEYVSFFLKKFRPFCNEICVVVNGCLTEASCANLESMVDKVLIRGNNGMDAGAYQYAIRHYGYEKLATYDELILCNFTVFGPLFSLQEMFRTMDAKQCDWWGLYRWFIGGEHPYRHIPSFFVVYRQKLLATSDFKDYWETLPPTNSYMASVLNHEQRQTPYYADKGYHCETYIDDLKYKKHWPRHWPLYCADRVVIEDKCPFVKRRIFFVHNGHFEYPSPAFNIIPFIRSHTQYDVNLIYENIKRTFFPTIGFYSFAVKWLWLSIKQILLPWKFRHYTTKKASLMLSYKLAKQFLRPL